VWVVDRDKERVKLWVISDIQSSATNIQYVSNRVMDMISQTDRSLGGSVTALDCRLNDCSRRALSSMSQALTFLDAALRCANQLDVEVWVSDD
jgi:hypothetical protein